MIINKQTKGLNPDRAAAQPPHPHTKEQDRINLRVRLNDRLVAYRVDRLVAYRSDRLVYGGSQKEATAL